MNRQFETAWQLHRFLTARGIPYAIIDGIAVQRWGQPRLTRDVDLTVLLPPGSEEATLGEIVAAFPPRVENAVAFALEHRVLPVDAPGGGEADISLGFPVTRSASSRAPSLTTWGTAARSGSVQRRTSSSGDRCAPGLGA